MKKSLSKFHSFLAKSLMQLGHANKALSVLDAASGLAPQHANLYFMAGNLLAQKKNLGKAAHAYRQAISLNSAVESYHLKLAHALIGEGQSEPAIASLKEALLIEPRNMISARTLGFQYQKTGQLDEAEKMFRRVLTKHPSAPVVTRALADVLDYQGKNAEAIALLNGELARNNNQADLHDRLGRILAMTGQLNAADTAFEQAKIIDCENLSADSAPFDTAELAVQEIERFCDEKANTAVDIQQCLRVLTRPGADGWAHDVIKILASEPQKLAPGDESWPVGRNRADYTHISVTPRPGTENNPQISIIIPVYEVGQDKWLRECIESILIQDRGEDWAEIIVVDDGSKSPVGGDIAKEYGPRVRYHYNSPNLGLLPNHNNCLNMARGDFIHFVHQDDLVEPGFYDAVLDPMLKQDDIVASFSGWKNVDANGNISGLRRIERLQAGCYPNLLQRLGVTTCLMFPAIIVRRSAYEKVGGFSPSFGFIFDLDMWARLAALGPVWYEPRPLAIYRGHDGSATHTFSKLEQLIDRMRVRGRILSNLPPSLRYTTARTGFDILLQICWWSLLVEPDKFEDADLKRTLDFLTQNWTTKEQKNRIEKSILQRRVC
ncbi:glycosyltransferase [Falsihalocynthiibacter sp. BN13B15]|uniref:glycosyltransferase n=1 Tax=Falsihalocynthiibacter sp. BN13B15 TaxID=3240871 RepID=UPI00350FCFBA